MSTRIADIKTYTRKYLTRKSQNFLQPLIIDAKTFQFPKNVIYYNFKVSDTIFRLDRFVPYLGGLDGKVIVKNILNYTSPTPVGIVHKGPLSDLSIKDVMVKMEKTFRYLTPLADKVEVRDKDLLTINFGALNHTYKYTQHPLNVYYKWYNCFNTIIDTVKINLSKTDKYIFMNYDLPMSLPSRDDLNKISKHKVNSATLNVLTDYTYFNLLELWNWLDPEQHPDTILSKLTYKELSKIIFMFTYENKIILINLAYLYNLNKEFNFTGEIGDINRTSNKLSKDMLRKYVYILIYKLIESTPADMEKIDNTADELTLKIGIKGVNGEEDYVYKDNFDDVDADTALEHDVIEKENQELDGELSNIEIKETIKDENTEVVESFDEIKDVDIGYSTKILKEVDKLKEFGIINKSSRDKNVTTIEKMLKSKSPFGDDTTIGEMLDDSKDVFELEEVEIRDTNVVFDKEYNKNVIGSMNKTYFKHQYKKDIVRSLFSVQLNNCIIEDISIEKTESILGNVDNITLKVNSLNGRATTLKTIIPEFSEDGSFKLSNNNYIMRPGKQDLPIRKIEYNMVALSSNYGKLFVSKATYAKDDLGGWIKKALSAKYEVDPEFKDLVTLACDNQDGKLPMQYSLIARHVKSFRLKDNYYFFEFKNRNKIIKDLTINGLNALEQNDMVLIGSSKFGKPLLIGQDNVIYVKEETLKPIGKLFDLLEIDIDDGPIEFINIRLYTRQMPIVLLIGYYFGLENVLKMLGMKYTLVNEKKVPITSKQYKIKFRDTTLVVDKDYGVGDSIIYGLTSIKDAVVKVDFKSLNNKAKYEILFHSMGLGVLYINEIKNLENLYIDHLTKVSLKKLKLPVNFKSLLVKACEILKDDNYINPNDVSGVCVKGYERIAGMLYHEIVTSLKEFNNKSEFSKSKITLNPYGMLAKINEDSTTVLVDDLNPISLIKQSEDLNSLGFGGRSKEGMNRDTREMHITEIGIVSEASKDSGDVGISAYLTATPNITNIKGLVSETPITEKTSWANMLSTSATLAPFATTEDVKRNNFINVQNSHTIFMDNMRVPFVRTGYETIISIKAGDKFVTIARKDGEVINVTKTFMEVKYKDDAKNTKHKIYSWTTKEESGACYTHTLIPNFKVGDKFFKDDSLLYDDKFFEPDIFNKSRTVYKSGTLVNVSLLEDAETWEDSAAISNKMSSLLGTKVTKVKSSKINNTDNILNNKKVGDNVEPSDVLFTIVDGNILNITGLDTKALEILQNIKSVSPKAKVRGTITKLVVYYNCELETLSDTLKAIVAESDKFLIATTGYPGRVNSSYSIEGIPLMENEVEIKAYIEVKDSMGIGDKAILANQLKFTVGDVYDYGIETIGGIESDVLFSNKSLAARIVNSPFLIGTASSILDILSKKVVSMFTSISKRKEVENLILHIIDKLDTGSVKPNTKLYIDLFKSLSNSDFENMMEGIKNQTTTLSIIVPNGGDVKIDVENNFRIAKELGFKFLDHLRFKNHPTLGTFITPNTYLTMMLPIRRAAQLLSKKISIPESDNKIDMLTGQVTGKSKSSKLTLPELQILVGMGLKYSIREMMKVRGGDLGAKNAMNAMLMKTGDASQQNIEPYATGVKSVQTLRAYWKAQHISTTL